MQIVFFHEKNQKIGGGLLQFISLANYLSQNTDHEVHYVDCYNASIAEFVEKTNVDYINITEFDTKGFEEAIFVTPPNYVFLLIEKIYHLKKARILLYDWHIYSSNFLKNQFKNQNINIAALYQFIDEKDGIAFMDNATRLSIHHLLGYLPQKRFIPIAKEKNLEHNFTILPRVKKDKISVAYLGRLDTDKIYSVINIADNLMEIDSNCTIEFHIIGDGNRRNLIQLSQYAGKITFIFTSYLLEDDMYSYLRNNIDVLITMGTALLNGAELGIPSVVVPVSNRRFYSNQYIFLHEMSDYTLGFSYDMIPSLNYNFRTLENILREALENKEEYGKKSYQYFVKNHLISHSAGLCMEWAQQSKLYVQDLIHLPEIKEQWEAFCRYHKQTGENYLEFYSSIRNDRAKQIKGRYALLRDKTIHLFENTIGKLQKTWALNLRKKNYILAQNHYENALKEIRYKAQKGEKIRVAFLVLYKYSFSSLPIYQLMAKDNRYETSIIAIPDVQRGIKHLREEYINTIHELKEIDDNVLEGYDVKLDEYLDISNKYDLIFFNNPYKGMVAPVHSIEHFLNENVLTFYVNYGFFTLKYGHEILKTDFYNYVWKVFIDSKENMQDLKKFEPIKGKNGVVSGYIKMDSLAKAKARKKEKKQILICPHHTVSGWTGTRLLALSNFQKYAEFILELPEKYPEIDFVFRPHPLLFYNLVSTNIWSKEKKEHYIERINKIPNIIYDTASNYFDTFANSDAIIHDCGSFIAEYLFTEKPCCYMLKDKTQIHNDFLPMGQECLKHYYKAYEKEDIYQFIDEVIIQEQDPLKKEREYFSRHHLKFNYPNGANFAYQYISNLLF